MLSNVAEEPSRQHCQYPGRSRGGAHGLSLPSDSASHSIACSATHICQPPSMHQAAGSRGHSGVSDPPLPSRRSRQSWEKVVSAEVEEGGDDAEVACRGVGARTRDALWG